MRSEAWWILKSLEKRIQQEELEEKAAPVKVNDYKIRKERGAELRKKRAALSRCEKKIEETDEEIDRLNQQLQEPEIVSDYVRTLELTEELSRLKDEADALMTEWTELTEWLEENDG